MNSAILKQGLHGAALAVALVGCIAGAGLTSGARVQAQGRDSDRWDGRDRNTQDNRSNQDNQRTRDDRSRNGQTDRNVQADRQRTTGQGDRVFRDDGRRQGQEGVRRDDGWRQGQDGVRRQEDRVIREREAERVWDAQHNRWIYRNSGGYYGGYPGGGYYGNGGYPGGYYGNGGGGYYGGGSGSEGQGYRDGLNRGREDARSGRRPSPNNSEHFRNGNPAYRAGFARGYQVGFRQSGGGGGYRRPF